MSKVLAHQVRASAPSSRPYTLEDEETGTRVNVVLRRLNPLESERASDQADGLAVRYIEGGWYDEPSRRVVTEPDTYVCSDGSALALSRTALHTACRFCASQVVSDETERYDPLEFLELCQVAGGIYTSALIAMSEVSARPKASALSGSSQSSERSS